MSGTFNVPLYGMTRWGDVFTARQMTAQLALVSELRVLRDAQARVHGAMVISNLADYGNALCRWRASSECADALFGRQAIPMVWDFAEPCSVAEAAGSVVSMTDRSAAGMRSAYVGRVLGQVELADATEHPLPDETCAVWFTDPPYYCAVPYADLSDFFFVWLKRLMPDNALLRDPFDSSNPLTPKARELCEMAHWDTDRYVYKDQAFFEDAFGLHARPEDPAGEWSGLRGVRPQDD